jgi:hypothetical protein
LPSLAPLQALWHSRLYMTTALGRGFLCFNKNQKLSENNERRHPWRRKNNDFLKMVLTK